MTEAQRAERRHNVRHRAKTKVRVRTKEGKSKVCSIVDLSPNGVGIKISELGLSHGQEVELTFMVNLGIITKMHHRRAMVQHLSGGVVGFSMASPKKSS